MGGVLGAHQVPQGAHEARDRARVQALGVDERPVDEGKMRAVHERVPVEEEEFLSHAGEGTALAARKRMWGFGWG